MDGPGLDLGVVSQSHFAKQKLLELRLDGPGLDLGVSPSRFVNKMNTWSSTQRVIWVCPNHILQKKFWSSAWTVQAWIWVSPNHMFFKFLELRLDNPGLDLGVSQSHFCKRKFWSSAWTVQAWIWGVSQSHFVNKMSSWSSAQ